MKWLKWFDVLMGEDVITDNRDRISPPEQHRFDMMIMPRTELWETQSARLGSQAHADRLAERWEPFAVTGRTLHFRRKVYILGDPRHALKLSAVDRRGILWIWYFDRLPVAAVQADRVSQDGYRDVLLEKTDDDHTV